MQRLLPQTNGASEHFLGGLTAWRGCLWERIGAVSSALCAAASGLTLGGGGGGQACKVAADKPAPPLCIGEGVLEGGDDGLEAPDAGLLLGAPAVGLVLLGLLQDAIEEASLC